MVPDELILYTVIYKGEYVQNRKSEKECLLLNCILYNIGPDRDLGSTYPIDRHVFRQEHARPSFENFLIRIVTRTLTLFNYRRSLKYFLLKLLR